MLSINKIFSSVNVQPEYLILDGYNKIAKAEQTLFTGMIEVVKDIDDNGMDCYQYMCEVYFVNGIIVKTVKK
jgi:hypothetical protein